MSPPVESGDIARFIEHTLLKPDASLEDIKKLCSEALENKFVAVCVSGSRVVEAYSLLEDSGVTVAAVVGFPLGSMDPDVKRYETEVAVDNGAGEIDVVLNVGRLKDGDRSFVLRELRDVVEAADERPVKVILEICLLTRDEMTVASNLVVESGARYVKTSTGFGASNGTIEDVRFLRKIVGEEFGIKAAGGIRDFNTAVAMIEAGANRLGTSSGVALLRTPGDPNL